MQSKKKILIVDEDSNYISGLKKELNNIGYDVIHWDDGKKALDLTNNIHPALILCGVDIQQSDGQSFFREVKSTPEIKKVPFIFLSNQKRVDDRIKSMELGIDDFIAKPFYIEEIVARIQNILNEFDTFGNHKNAEGKGFSGNLSEMNLIDLMQTLEVGKKSATIKLKYEQYEGTVYIKDGNVVDANLGDLSSKDALSKLFLWTDGQYHVQIAQMDYPRTINLSNEQLVNEGRNRTIHWEQLKKNLPALNTYVAVNEIAFDANNITENEKKILLSINGKTMIYDIIFQSPLDDIKSMEIVDNLYRKGYLKETNENYTAQSDNYLIRLKQNLSQDSSDKRNVSSIISNLLKRASETKDIKFDRRREERRQLPERRQFERRKDHRVWENRIYLDKAELLMIREKLV